MVVVAVVVVGVGVVVVVVAVVLVVVALIFKDVLHPPNFFLFGEREPRPLVA
jgi:hypothetical protein